MSFAGESADRTRDGCGARGRGWAGGGGGAQLVGDCPGPRAPRPPTSALLPLDAAPVEGSRQGRPGRGWGGVG